MKTVEQIKDEYAKEQGYIDYKNLVFTVISTHPNASACNLILSYENVVIQLIEDELKKHQAEQINMYKECLELFLTTDKWDEATLFLSTYGSVLAKDLSNKENIK
ncbi:hypothetical protein ACTS9C_05365 [Empedobacter brevis]